MLYEKFEGISDIDFANMKINEDIEHYEVTMPTEEYAFLHEAIITEFKGILFCAWYNNEKHELSDKAPIRFARSFDGGKNWEDPIIVAVDETKKIMYCPPVFGECDGKLYMLLNQMVGADLIHSLDLYVYNEETGKFDFLWSRPVPFKLNTNVYTLNNGKLILTGRIAELDGFPNTPAVLISDSGKIDDIWRLVKMQEDGSLPGDTKLVHPEVSLIIEGETVYAFCRNDNQDKCSLLYISEDNGETWEKPYVHDIPFVSSKIYSGKLGDGRNYVIGNIQAVYDETPRHRRDKLAIFFSEPNTMKFNKGFLIHDGVIEEKNYGRMWHYPAACEYNGKLYVVCSVDCEHCETATRRGAVVSIIDLDKI